MTRPRSMLAASIAALVLGSLGSGLTALSNMASSAGVPTFGQRYGANPRSTGNGGQGINVMRAMRLARKRATAGARAPKKSALRRANIGARMAAARASR